MKAQDSDNAQAPLPNNTLREDWGMAIAANRELMLERANNREGSLYLTHLIFGWLIIPLAVAFVRFNDWRNK